jgi:hypothetical protein
MSEIKILSDLVIDEVSLVKKGANRKKKFPVMKSANTDDLVGKSETSCSADSDAESITGGEGSNTNGEAAADIVKNERHDPVIVPIKEIERKD